MNYDPKLIEDCQEVFASVYDKTLTDDEAIEFLDRLADFGSIVLEIQKKKRG